MTNAPRLDEETEVDARPSVATRNLIANFAGRIFTSFSVYLFAPLYISLLGSEAYGLVGLFAVLQTIFAVVDFGLSGAFTREVARLSTSISYAPQLHSLTRTFESLFVALALFATTTIVLLAQPIATYWLNNQALSHETVVYAIMLMGIAVGTQFPFVIYQGGLLGLQRQVSLNILLIAVALLRGIGGLAVLWLVYPSVTVYFAWQAAISVLQLVIARWLFFRYLPPAQSRPQRDFGYIRQLGAFAVTLALSSIAYSALTQLDKVFLSKLLPLEQFGKYALTSTAASMPYLLGGSFVNVAYPRLTQLIETKDTDGLTRSFHLFAQGLALMALTGGIVIAVFAREVMLVWTGNPVFAAETGPILQIQVIGWMFFALTLMPYTLQLAAGAPKYELIFNIAAVVAVIPALWFAIQAWGALGAAAVWAAVNVAHVFVLPWFIFRDLAPFLRRTWYLSDVLQPLLVISIFVILVRLLLPTPGDQRVEWFFYLGFVTLATATLGLFSMPNLRQQVLLGTQQYSAQFIKGLNRTR